MPPVQVADPEGVTAVNAPKRCLCDKVRINLEIDMPDWLIAVIGGVVLLAVCVKAFWRPAQPDPLKPETTELPPGAGGRL